MDISKIIAMLADKPLNEGKYLVNRGAEISHLKSIVKYQPFGIFGLCGETGIGKTTILNLLNVDEVKKIEIVLTNRETKESILYDLLYKISLTLKNDKNKELKEIANDTLNWITQEVSIIKGATLSTAFLSGKLEKQKMPRFNVFAAEERLRDMLDKSVSSYEKVLLVIDELDKEKKDDVLNVLDSFKLSLQGDNLISIFSLPYSIYREYRNDRIRWNESGNLENIIKDVVFLEALNDSEIKEVILKRIGDFAIWFEDKSLDALVLFSDGNPRDALWITQKVVFDNINARTLSEQMCRNSILKIVKEYMSGISLTQLQKKALLSLRNFMGSREELFKILDKSGFKRTTVYSTFDRLLSMRMIIERQGTYRISGKAYYLPLE